MDEQWKSGLAELQARFEMRPGLYAPASAQKAIREWLRVLADDLAPLPEAAVDTDGAAQRVVNTLRDRAAVLVPATWWSETRPGQLLVRLGKAQVSPLALDCLGRMLVCLAVPPDRAEALHESLNARWREDGPTWLDEKERVSWRRGDISGLERFAEVEER